MQQENFKNPFESITKLWRVEFNTKFKHIALLELMFEESTSAISCYEISSESIEAAPEDLWKFVCYFSFRIDKKHILSQIKDFFEGELAIVEEQEQDWVSKVQMEAKAVDIGGFYVANSTLIQNCPSNLIPINIDAGRAFGTGEHATTKGCLEMISKVNLKLNTTARPQKILDVGTGTGILAIACKKLWQKSDIIATDIDEIALKIAAENSKENSVDIKFVTSYEAESHFEYYDLIISNILATPLIHMAPDFKRILKNKGLVILSGFTQKQLPEIAATYIGLNFEQLDLIEIDDWCIILYQHGN